MNVGDLIAEYRDEANDEVAPFLVSDATLIRYANDAQMEAATRARFFIDSTIRIKVKAGSGLATLDPKIIYVRGARVLDNDVPLRPRYRKDMDCWPGWEAETGDAMHFIKDYTSGKLRLHPIPTVDVVLAVTAVRGPLNDLAGTGDDLEIPIRYQQKLVYWMLHRAFAKKDVGGDARDDRLAKEYEDRFAMYFGPPRNAADEVFEQQQEDVYDDQGGSY